MEPGPIEFNQFIIVIFNSSLTMSSAQRAAWLNWPGSLCHSNTNQWTNICAPENKWKCFQRKQLSFIAGGVTGTATVAAAAPPPPTKVRLACHFRIIIKFMFSQYGLRTHSTSGAAPAWCASTWREFRVAGWVLGGWASSRRRKHNHCRSKSLKCRMKIKILEMRVWKIKFFSAHKVAHGQLGNSTLFSPLFETKSGLSWVKMQQALPLLHVQNCQVLWVTK